MIAVKIGLINGTQNTIYSFNGQGAGIITGWQSGSLDKGQYIQFEFAAGPGGNYFAVVSSGTSGSICGFVLNGTTLTYNDGVCHLTSNSSGTYYEIDVGS
jgi:hypothetical protein